MDAAPRPALPPGRVAEAGLLAASGALLAVGCARQAAARASGSLATVGIAAIVVRGGRRSQRRCAACFRCRGSIVAGTAAVAALAALTRWAGLSIAWSIAGDLSWEWLARGLVYLAFLALGLLAGALGGGARRVAAITALVIAAALGWALLGVAVPSLFPDGDRIARLREPVGYWNALALLADTGIALGLWAARNRRAGARIAGLLLVYGAVLALLLTQSRAGVVGAVVVLALWLALSDERLDDALQSRCGGRPGSRRRGLGVHAAGARRGRRVARGSRRRTGGCSQRWPSPGRSSLRSVRGVSRWPASSPTTGKRFARRSSASSSWRSSAARSAWSRRWATRSRGRRRSSPAANA